MSDQPDPTDLHDAIPTPDESLRRAIETASERLAGIVEGVGQGTTADGRPAVAVMVAHAGLEGRIPAEIEGFPVEVIVTGAFQAQLPTTNPED